MKCPDCDCDLEVSWHDSVHEVWAVQEEMRAQYKRAKWQQTHQITIQMEWQGKTYRGVLLPDEEA